MEYRLIIFDLDGTLADTEQCITASMTAALDEFGVAGHLARLRRNIGLPLDQIIRGLVDVELDDPSVAEIARLYRGHYAACQDGLVKLYPGTAVALDELSRLGIDLAIASSKITTAVEALLRKFDIARIFACVVSGEQVVKGKPAPDMVERVLELTSRTRAEALMVGDTTYDVEMAQLAGVDSCAVTYGNQSAEMLIDARPTHLAASMADVVSLVK
jgi:phosphoglycolate phosphatase